VIPLFALPIDVCRIIYTTNAIEALNAKLRRAVTTRGHFPTDEAAFDRFVVKCGAKYDKAAACLTKDR